MQWNFCKRIRKEKKEKFEGTEKYIWKEGKLPRWLSDSDHDQIDQSQSPWSHHPWNIHKAYYSWQFCISKSILLHKPTVTQTSLVTRITLRKHRMKIRRLFSICFCIVLQHFGYPHKDNAKAIDLNGDKLQLSILFICTIQKWTMCY